MIADAIRTLLVNANTTAGSRIAADVVREQETRPYVRITEIGGAVILVHDGASGHRRYNFQVSAFADTGAAARTLIEQCRTALHMYSGTVGGDVIQSMYVTREPSVIHELNPNVYHASADFEAGYVG